MKKFNSDKICENHFTKVKFKNGHFCSHCGSKKKIYILKTKTKYQMYKCSDCQKKFSIITNTVFSESKVGLQKWYIAYYLLTNSSKGISSVQLSKYLQVQQRTAWFMLHRLRETAKQNTSIFQGAVEVDETFVGGKEKNKHASKKKGKIAEKAVVVGMVDRETKQVKASHVPDSKAMTLKGYIYDHVKFGSEIMTDDNMAYRKINPCYKHKTVCHSAGEYKDGNCHTNNIENFWSIFKRGYIGVYHYMSKKHLQRFINEFAFRYNYRDTKDNEYNKLFISLASMNKKLSYKELING